MLPFQRVLCEGMVKRNISVKRNHGVLWGTCTLFRPLLTLYLQTSESIGGFGFGFDATTPYKPIRNVQ